jgi:glycosyltransferase involved in cell wall biosynthesis
MVTITKSDERGPSRHLSQDRVLLSVVVPCFNEQEVIEQTYSELVRNLGYLAGIALQFVVIDDGSKDHTTEILNDLRTKDKRIKLVRFSRNFGHQAAIAAGLAHADGDIVAVIDADLQDPPQVIVQMIDKWREGFDVIYGIRRGRKEYWLKRFAYLSFYRIFRSISSSIDAPLDAGDFCLMDRRVVDVLIALPERNQFLRGLRSWVGFKQTGLVYERAVRPAGESKYSLTKLFRLALDGIFNFSTLPLEWVFFVGMAMAGITFLGLLGIVLQRVFNLPVFGVHPSEIPGFALTVLTILFIGGVQMTCIGILGEYIARIYEEVKHRPRYIIVNDFLEDKSARRMIPVDEQFPSA